MGRNMAKMEGMLDVAVTESPGFGDTSRLEPIPKVLNLVGRRVRENWANHKIWRTLFRPN
jgi:hypothetical protein